MKFKTSYLLSILCLCTFILPTNAETIALGGPVVVKKSKSNSPIGPVCLQALDDEVYFHIINGTTEDIDIEYIDIQHIANNTDFWGFEFSINGSPITLQYPYGLTLNAGDILDITGICEFDLYTSHVSYNGSMEVETMFTWKYTYKQDTYETENVHSQVICPLAPLLKTGDTPDCELMYENKIQFSISNEIIDVLTVDGLNASFDNNPYNGIAAINFFDGNGEEEIELPTEIAPMEEEGSSIIVELVLEHPLGYPNYGSPAPEQSFDISLEYEYTLMEFSFSNLETFGFNFEGCGEKSAPTIQVFPNPVELSSVAEFEVTGKSAIVSAYIVSTNPKDKSVVHLLNKEFYTKGTYQIEIPGEQLKSGIYQLVLEINGAALTKSLLKVKE